MNAPTANQAVRELSAPLGMTLSRFIAQEQKNFPEAKGELSQLLGDISLASKIMNRDINRAGLINTDGSIGTSNIQGEEQQKLDVIADARFFRALRKGGEVCCMISEEVDELIDSGNHQSKYVVAIDPLDGSSNIDVNVSIGTIFSIFKRITPLGSPPTQKDALQPGRVQIASGYVLYGSSTILVFTTGHGVNGFTFEVSIGEFFLSHPNIRIPENGKIFSCNEGNLEDFPSGIKSYLNECREKKMSGRYIGSLVADFHRNLLKGGIYLYPPTHKAEKGKLRLQYECNALAYIVEQAGGMASDGNQRIMDIQPEKLHQRVPFYVGSYLMLERLLEFVKE